MNDESEYLQELHQELDRCIAELDKTNSNEPVDHALYETLQKTIEKEKELREKHHIDVRFSILRTQLQELLNDVKKEIGLIKETAKAKPTETTAAGEDETGVYVYLFNATGNNLNTWSKLLTPNAFFEHSVNRPIYASKEDVEKMLRNKANKDQHGYIEMTVKKADVLASKETTTLQDPNGFPLLRLKQGALKIGQAKGFFHKNIQYKLGKNGGLMKI